MTFRAKTLHQTLIFRVLDLHLPSYWQLLSMDDPSQILPLSMKFQYQTHFPLPSSFSIVKGHSLCKFLSCSSVSTNHFLLKEFPLTNAGDVHLSFTFSFFTGASQGRLQTDEATTHLYFLQSNVWNFVPTM